MRRIRVLFVLALAAACALPSLTASAPIPDFTFATDQGVLRLDSLRGKVVYLDYWASWCVPCRQSFPWMNEMHSRYGDKGLVIVAVNVDRDAAEARSFLTQYPAAFIVAYDPEGKTAKALALKGMPSSFVIDRQGQIVGAHVGFREAAKAGIAEQIEALLGVPAR